MPAYIAVLLKKQEENARYPKEQVSQYSLSALFQPKSCRFSMHHSMPRSFLNALTSYHWDFLACPSVFIYSLVGSTSNLLSRAYYLYIALYVLDLDELH